MAVKNVKWTGAEYTWYRKDKSEKIMKVVFIGAGNLATNLAKALYKSGNRIVQVYSRTMESARMLAEEVASEPTTSLDAVAVDADIYIISVKDSVLKGVIETLCANVRQGLFVHTAGSMSVDIFKGHASRYGVFYPMQSFSKLREVDFSDIPFFIEANNDADKNLLHDMASTLSDSVYEISSEARKHLHLAAVFACNFANHCYELSGEVLEKYGIPFSVMLPLIDETARKVHSVSPRTGQTGPAVRYDENVINMQRGLLADNPRIQRIYDVMSDSIHEVATSRENEK